jgi:SAM-dependent methyltransferase
MKTTEHMYDKFLDEYVSEQAVRKYTTETAGYGVSYLLNHDYAQIYLKAVNSYLLSPDARPLRLLEFGCGGGMNITRLVALLTEKQIPVERAYGTDFSPRLVQAAKEEARNYLPPAIASKLSFYVARNEQLEQDLLTALDEKKERLGSSFDLIIGVNTFRYCNRLGKQIDCAKDIYRLLRPGGVCVNIDMNDRFPAFRSRFRRSSEDGEECYLPSLEEYVSPFETAGFEIIKKGNFCWVPHSAGRALTTVCRLAAPLLNLVARNRAMRSLVVARKPA